MIEKSNKIAVFADGVVGKDAIEYLLQNFKHDLEVIVCVDKLAFLYTDFLKNVPDLQDKISFSEDLKNNEFIDLLKKKNLQYIILAWWPFIIKEPILSMSEKGIINFHPSLLPHNRGKHYNFWTIVEESPFGVSLHFIDESVDGGDILFQKAIIKTWEDTGASLYEKAQQATMQLFRDSYPKIREGDYIRTRQTKEKGSFHLSRELDNASKINLEQEYKAKDLLNVIRARTFPPHPGAWFEFEGDRYEIKVEIKKL